MLIQHIAFVDHWRDAVASGVYDWSTRGRTRDDVGFIHASRPDQTAGVLQRYYADVEAADLVVLVIDTDLLDVPWRLDPVGDDEYPHVYGPLRVGAVVDVRAPGTT